MGVADLQVPDAIRAVWSMHDYLVWPRDSRDYRGA